MEPYNSEKSGGVSLLPAALPAPVSIWFQQTSEFGEPKLGRVLAEFSEYIPPATVDRVQLESMKDIFLELYGNFCLHASEKQRRAGALEFGQAGTYFYVGAVGCISTDELIKLKGAVDRTKGRSSDELFASRNELLFRDIPSIEDKGVGAGAGVLTIAALARAELIFDCEELGEEEYRFTLAALV